MKNVHKLKAQWLFLRNIFHSLKRMRFWTCGSVIKASIMVRDTFLKRGSRFITSFIEASKGAVL